MNQSLLKFGKLCVITAVMSLSACATMNGPELQPLTLEKIVALAKEGKDAQAIINEIKVTRTTYDVAASQYAKLSRDGVPDAVLDFMQQGQLKMAEREGRREAREDLWLYGRGWGWGYGGAWAPRPYVVYVGGRHFSKSY
jgi:hypothetical protein